MRRDSDAKSVKMGQKMTLPLISPRISRPRQQRGITTLAITLILLVILTLMVLFSTNVGFFESRTATSEFRSRMAEQAAEYALNLSGEYLKSQREVIVSSVSGFGWLASTGGSRRWFPCASAAPFSNTSHPCFAERDNGAGNDPDSLTVVGGRRAQMYFYRNGVGGSLNLPYSSVAGSLGQVQTGEGAFDVNTNVRALLCRVDSSLPDPDCRLTPASGNNIAITLIAETVLPNENAASIIKETWATYSDNSPLSSVPLVAAGFVEGTGNVEIVTAPNAGGYGLPVSVWAPNDVDVDKTGGGSAASISSCHIGEFLKGTPENELKTTCVTDNNACGCPAANSGSSDFLSGKVPGASPPCCENLDILDRDGNKGVLPDLQFFPGTSNDGTRLDKVGVETDGSLFEWIFNVDYVVDDANQAAGVRMDCAGPANCAEYALIEEYKATVLSDCSTLGPGSSGIYYVTGACNLPAQVGSPTNSVIVVVNDDARLNSTRFYGMLFVRSDDNSATLRANGNSTVVGSVVVEGNAVIAGGLRLIYDDSAAGQNPEVIPRNAKFGKVPGSWLDSRQGF